MNKREQILELVSKGNTTKEISEITGIAISTIRYHRECRLNNCCTRIAEHRIRIKKKAIDYLGGFCVKCGYNNSVHGLSFHHLDPKIKTLQISSGRTRSWDNIKTELDKCVMLCLRCHGEFHGHEWDIEQQMIDKCENARKQYVDKPLENYRTDQDNRKVNVIKNPNTCKTCGKETFNAVYCNNKCAIKGAMKIYWPANLEELVNNSSKLQIARLLGVSDKAVSKRLARNLKTNIGCAER